MNSSTPLYRLIVRGIPVDCFSLEAVTKLLLAFGSDDDQVDSIFESQPTSVSQKPDREVGEHSLTILQTVAEAKMAGVHTPEIAEALGLPPTEGRAVGGPTLRLRLDLEALGFNPNRVYTTKRDGQLGRKWKMGGDIHRAIAAVKGGDAV